MTLKKFIPAIMLLVSSGTGEASERNYLQIDSLQQSSIMPCLDAERVSAIEVRVAMPDAHVGSRCKSAWILTWQNGGCQVALTFDFRNYVDGVTTTASITNLEVNGKSYKVAKGVDLDGGFNSLAIEWANPDSDIATISVGNKIPQEMASASLPRPESEEQIRIIAAPESSKIDVAELILETELVPEQKLATEWDYESLQEHFDSDYCAPIEGFWEYMDRENEPRIAQIGGRYRVGIAANDCGGYDIIYLDGARVNADKWHSGMLKGQLQPTIFTGQYRLVWYDATFEPISADSYAELTQAALLTLQFPTLSASIRLSKVLTR
jgi:hypothetical protein